MESPPTENGGHNLSEIISGVLPGESEDSKRLFAQRGVHGPLRNGSLTVITTTKLAFINNDVLDFSIISHCLKNYKIPLEIKSPKKWSNS